MCFPGLLCELAGLRGASFFFFKKKDYLRDILLSLATMSGGLTYAPSLALKGKSLY